MVFGNMYDIEEFRDVVGFEDLYEVSDEGRVRNKNTGRILKPNKINKGYLQVILCKDGERKPALVHRLVAKAFISNPNHYPQVNHIDENKSNNHVENLEYCTNQYNIRYSAYKKNKPVNTYKSTLEAAEQNPGTHSQNISGVCRGICKTHKGYIWKYVS